MTQPTEPATQSVIGLSVRTEDLCLLVTAGDHVIAAQLSPQGALELARDLLNAGLAHAAARVEHRLQSQAAGEGPPLAAH